MIDREKVLSVLRKRFPEATVPVLAAAANAIVGLDDEWEEVTGKQSELPIFVPCGAHCGLASDFERGVEFRVFRRSTTLAIP